MDMTYTAPLGVKNYNNILHDEVRVALYVYATFPTCYLFYVTCPPNMYTSNQGSYPTGVYTYNKRHVCSTCDT